MRTRVFELASQYGYNTDRALAEAMGITPFMVSRVKAGKHKITEPFIAGARRAFPDKSLDELFIVEADELAIA